VYVVESAHTAPGGDSGGGGGLGGDGVGGLQTGVTSEHETGHELCSSAICDAVSMPQPPEPHGKPAQLIHTQPASVYVGSSTQPPSMVDMGALGAPGAFGGLAGMGGGGEGGRDGGWQ